MKTLMILHEVFMVVAEVLIILGVITARKKPTSKWLNQHKLFVTFGILFVFISAVCIYTFKETHSYPHFSSFHALIGVLGIFLIATNYLVGFGLVKNLINKKVIHHTIGRLTAFVIIIAAGAGVVRFIQILNS